MRLILISASFGAIVMGMVGSLTTFAPGLEFAGPAYFAACGALLGILFGAVGYVIIRMTRGRR